MFKKAFISSFLAFTLMFGTIAVPVFAEEDYSSVTVSKILSNTNVNQLQAKGAILIDAATGIILQEQNIHSKLPIASVTKVMSMLLIMEALDNGKIKLDDKVVISDHAVSMGGSQLYLDKRESEKYTVKDMLKGVAIHSSNDATVAMAEMIGGSEDGFVKMMNDRAKELGLTDSNFLDCTGLTDDGHYSSAYDIATISRELIVKHPKILEFTSIKRDKFGDGVRQNIMDLDNTNKLLGRYEGLNGLKTGFTTKAGHNLSATATKNGLQLISVVLGEQDSNTRFAETIKLLDYGFTNFESTTINKKGDEVSEVEVSKGIATKVMGIFNDDVKALIKKGDKSSVAKEITFNEGIKAPIKAGDKIGEAVFKSGDREVAKVDIVAKSDVEKASFFKLFIRMITDWFKGGK